MTGRWRSRHWRSGEGNDEPRRPPSRGGGEGRAEDDDGRGRERWGGGEGRQRGGGETRWGGGGGGGDRSADGSGRDGADPRGHRPRQQWQEHPRQQHPRQHHRQPQPKQQQPRWKGRSEDGGEWQRGTSMGGRSGHASRERSASRRGGEERGRVKPERHSSAGRTGSAGRDTGRTGTGASAGRPARATFPAAPSRAWGGGDKNKLLGANPSVASPSSTERDKNNRTGAVKMEEGRGWARPDANGPPAAKAAVAAKKETSAWPRPNAGATAKAAAGSASSRSASKSSPSPGPVSILAKREDGESDKPPAKIVAKNSSPWGGKPAAVPGNDASKLGSIATDPAFPPWNAAEGGKKKAPPAAPAAVPPSLPPASSWGKAAARSTTATTMPGPAKAHRKKAKGEDFPSLSTASSRAQPPKAKPPAKVVTPVNAKAGKGKESKKGPAAPASLGAFLAPPSGSAGGKGQKKKNPPSQPARRPVGVKRGNDALLRPTPLDIKSHPGMSNMPNMAGMKRSAAAVAAGPGGPPGAPPPGGVDFPVGGVVKKGRRRLGPRKKKLTTLKKRVLQERLRVWNERNGIADGGGDAAGDGRGGGGEGGGGKRLKTSGSAAIDESTASAGAVGKPSSTTLLVENFVRPDEDDLEDDDEHDEIVSNVISLVGRVGRVLSVFVPRPRTSAAGDGMEQDGQESSSQPEESSAEAKRVGSSFVRFGTTNDACAAKDILNEMVVGGQKIRTSILQDADITQFNDNWSEGTGAAAPSAENDRLWRIAVLKAMDGRGTPMDEGGGVCSSSPQEVSSSGPATVAFHKILCDDDYDDEEALAESVEDIKGLAQQYGRVEGARAATTGDDKGNIYIVYSDCSDAARAVERLNGLVVGGSKVLVSTDSGSPPQSQQSRAGEVVLTNVLNDDDFEDEDCLKESLEDIKSLALKHGTIGNVDAELSGDHKGKVTVVYLDGQEAAQKAAQSLNGMVVGGATISASVASYTVGNSSIDATTSGAGTPTNGPSGNGPPPPPPMYSGDKVLPERFAACKRVPKIPNPGTPRAYATKIHDERALPTLISMLGELMRLQERSKDDKNARARRRLVMGLREVARGIRARKVKMVVMANNLDDYGAIDSKLEEILELARAEDLPVLFEMNKRKLGKALGKSIKVSVVGVQNADGAHEQFKLLKKMMGLA